jgi:RHS repeat-associated protein
MDRSGGRSDRIAVPSQKKVVLATNGGPTSPSRPLKVPAPKRKVTSPQSDTLSVSAVRYASLYPPDYVFGWCKDEAYAVPGNNLTICSYVAVNDSISGAQVPTTNSSHVELYDACGQLVSTWDLGAWHVQGTNYFTSGTIYTAPYIPVPSSYCFGTWLALVSFTQTFTDGVTLTATAGGLFFVVPNQQTPTGGAIQAQELYGGCGCGYVTHGYVGSPVDTATGNFWHSFDDLAIPGRGLALELSRTYNSLAAGTAGRFGYGWTDSYGMSLNIGPSTTVVTQENGSQITFTLNGSTWSAPPRASATLVHNGDDTWTFTRYAREILTFDASGRIIQIRDLNGYATSISYPNGSTQVITDPAGRTFTLSLSNGRVTSVTDSSSPPRSLTYTYNGSGELTDVIDVGGGHAQFTYDGSHRMLTMRSPRFYGDTITTPPPITTNHYDAQGRVDWQSDPLGRTTTFDYTSIANSTKVTDPKGNVTVYGYQDGLLVSKTMAYGTDQQGQWLYRYDPDTLGIVATVDPLGHGTTDIYDSAGNKTSQTDPLSRTTTYTYNSLNEVTSITEPKKVNGQPIVQSMTYDTAGNLLTKSAPLLDANGAIVATATTTYHHDDPQHPGDVTSVTDPIGHTTSYGYDSFGDLTSVTDPPTAENPSGNKTTYGYDTGRAWRTSMVAPKGNVSGADPALYTTTYAHDAYGRVTVTKDPLWTSSSPTEHRRVNHYDADGNLDSVTDGDNHITTYVFDPAEELTEAHRADGSILRTEYWPDGTVHRQIDGAGQARVYDYDPAARVTTVTDPLSRATSFTYDSAGKVKTKTDASNRVTTYTYDVANQLTAISYSDGTTPGVSTIGYDADGQRISMTDGTGTSTWSYDSLHRLTSTTNGAGQTVGYGYDLGGRLTAIAYPGSTGTVTRHYDDANRLDWIQDWATRQTSFGYDENSNLVTQTYPNGTSETTTVDRANRVMGIADAPISQPNSPFVQFTYGRDGGDLVTSVTSTGVPSDNHAWGYNQLNQLASVDANAYGYDTADNLIRRLDGMAQGYDVANEVRAAATSITLIGTASAGNSNTSSLTLTLPAGKAANDQIIVAVTLPNNKSVTTPTGYTVVGTYTSGNGASAAKVVIFRRTAAAGDTSVTLSFGQTFAKSATLALYRNVSTTSPVDVTPTSAGTSGGTSVTAPSVTTVTQLDQLLMVTGANGASGTWTAPTGMTRRVQQAGGTTDNAIMDQALNQAGATGTRQATHSTSTNLVGVLLALKPVPTVYTYDSQGNRTTATPPIGAATTLGYDQGNRLTSFAASGTTATYTYNGDGLRASKTVNATPTSYTWDLANNLPLLLAEGTTDYIYGPGELPLEQVSGSSVLYYHHDQLGSTRALTDTGGSVVATYSYDPYGKVTGSTGSATNPFGYASEYKDAESGLVYLRARYYDPVTSQLLSQDPLTGATGSPYGYVSGNPLNSTDPSGLWCLIHNDNGGCLGAGVATRIFNDVYHPLRAAVTAPVTGLTLSVDYAYSLLPGRDVDCHWNSREWVAVCSGGPTILGAPATTFGGVINTSLSYSAFLQANNCRLLAHEVKHTDQWAIFGPGFAGLDALAAGGDWLGSKIFGWDPGTHNPFEIWAGLKDGGYR